MKAKLERAFGGLILALIPLIALGMLAGWHWAFVGLLVHYFLTFGELYLLCMPRRKEPPTNAND